MKETHDNNPRLELFLFSMKRVIGFRLHKLSNNRSQKFVYLYQVCSNDQVARVFGNSHATFEVLEVDKKLEGIVMLI